MPQDLGWAELSLKFGSNTVRLTRSIGVHRISVVYEGKLNNESVAVKIVKRTICNDDTIVMTPIGERINNLQKKDGNNALCSLRNDSDSMHLIMDEPW